MLALSRYLVGFPIWPSPRWMKGYVNVILLQFLTPFLHHLIPAKIIFSNHFHQHKYLAKQWHEKMNSAHTCQEWYLLSTHALTHTQSCLHSALYICFRFKKMYMTTMSMALAGGWDVSE
jgi:hypothetical protein